MPPLLESQALSLVLREFDWYPYRLERRGKVTKVFLSHGTYGIKRSSASSRRLVNLAQTLDSMAKGGTLPVLPFVPNKYGDPVIEIGGDVYYALPWVDQDGTAQYRTDWEAKVLGALGRFHASTCRYVPLEGALLRSLVEVKNRWRKLLVQWHGWKKELEGAPFLSRGESALIQALPRLLAYGQKSIFLMDKWIGAHLGSGKLPMVLCHGRLNRSHVLWKNDQIYFLCYDYATWTHPVFDLAPFFRLYLDSFPPFSPETGWCWLQAYLDAFPLTHSDLLLLSIFLINPESVFLLANCRHLQQGRSFSSFFLEESLRRLDHLIQLVEFLLGPQALRANPSEITG